MKVKELIEILSRLNPEFSVVVKDGNFYSSVHNVSVKEAIYDKNSDMIFEKTDNKFFKNEFLVEVVNLEI